MRSKGQISLNFGFHVYFKDFYTKLCAIVLTIKDRKHIEQNFHSVARVMPQGWDLGVLGGSKTLAWGFAMAPHRLRILVDIYEDCLFVLFDLILNVPSTIFQLYRDGSPWVEPVLS